MTIQAAIRNMNQPTTLTLRPYTADDTPFIQAVYDSSREPEMALADWTAEQKTAFLQMQCQAQLAHYQTHYPTATHDIILVDEQPVGRLYIDRYPQEIRLMDITLLPAYRNQGIGTRLIQTLLDEADQLQKTVSLHVEMINPDAYRLYDRLGFTAVTQQGIHIFMERLPQPVAVPLNKEVK